MVCDATFCEAKSSLAGVSVLVVALFEGEELAGRVDALNLQSGGFFSKAMAVNHFIGSEGEIFSAVLPNPLESCQELQIVFFVGLGRREEFDTQRAREIGGKIFKALNAAKFQEASILVEDAIYSRVLEMAYGVMDKSYVFDRCRQVRSKEHQLHFSVAKFLVDNEDYAASEVAKVKARLMGVNAARYLIDSPPNYLNPGTYHKELQTVMGSTFDKVKVEVLDAKQLLKLGMRALVGVGMASNEESRMIIIRYNGAEDKDEKPLVFVGKGITFDSGGLSLKPAHSMIDMKSDMSGSAVVAGVIKTLVLRAAKVNVVGVLPIAENAVGSRAQRPGDVVTSMSGKTIEILNTDAEGRLILADALTYVQEFLHPALIVDLATLTGAIVVALGSHYAGCFANDQSLADKLIAAGRETGDLLWQFPMGKSYDKQIDSDIADVKNIAGKGEGGDSIIGAQFLRRFVSDNVPWAHIDIAGVSFGKGGKGGATGFGINLLDRFIANIELERLGSA